MGIDELVENAQGTIWRSVLLKSWDGFVPPGVIEWSPDKAPIDYLGDGERPHFVSLSFDRAVEVQVEENCNIREQCRFPLSDVRKSIRYDNMIGSVSAYDPFSTILLITNHRILLLVGQEEEDLKIEFRYSEDISIRFEDQRASNVPTAIISADDLEYHIDFWIQERRKTYDYLKDECSIDVGRHPEFGSNGRSEASARNISGKTPVRLSSLLQLTPAEFEEYISSLWQAMHYSCYTTKTTRDGGVDVVADDGNNRVLIQAKRYSRSNVGIDTVQRTAGLLVDEEFDASSVVIVTTSDFTTDARERASQISNLQLINGDELVALDKRIRRETEE